MNADEIKEMFMFKDLDEGQKDGEALPKMEAEAPKNIFVLSGEELERLTEIKARIREGILTGDAGAEIVLKAAEVLAIFTHDKKYLLELKRICKTIWEVYGLNVEGIPAAFLEIEAQERLLALREAECFKTPQVKADIQKAIAAQERKLERLKTTENR